MRRRKGFTLTELLMAVIIFGLILSALTAIYSTAIRHTFQGYRQNMLKNNAALAIKSIQNLLPSATRIDSPEPEIIGLGAPPTDSATNTLSFASNVDRMIGCYPINKYETPSWHHFCLAGSGPYDLYYYTGDIAGGTGCELVKKEDVRPWVPAYPSECGQEGGILLVRNVSPLPGKTLFSRRIADGGGGNTVMVNLRIYWRATDSGAGGARDLDHTVRTAVSVQDLILE